MAQYLLASFSQNLPPSASSGTSVEDLINKTCNNCGGHCLPFPLAMDLSTFTTQDQLYKSAGELEKYDPLAFSLLTRITRCAQDLTHKILIDRERGFSDICPDQFPQVITPCLQVTISEGDSERQISIDQYLKQWTWNENTFTKDEISLMTKNLFEEIARTEEELRASQSAYTEAGNRITAIRRRGEGSLLVRSLDEIGSSLLEIKNYQDYCGSKSSDAKLYINTTNLSTILVVVKKGNKDEFIRNYEKEPHVVPKSIAQLAEDNEFTCFAVTIQRIYLDDFKNWANKYNFHVREFVYNKDMRNIRTQEDKDAINSYLDISHNFAEFLEKKFSHMAIVWAHVKALRIFTESTLQYGIPPKFKVFVIEAVPKNLQKITKSLDSVFTDGFDDDEGDDNSSANPDSEYHPYVCYHINLSSFSIPNK